MTWPQAVRYFIGEALLSLRRGWRVSLLAILTIAVSLLLGGLLVLLSYNLNRHLSAWRSEARVVVYFSPNSDEAVLEMARSTVDELSWVQAVDVVTLEQARSRFAEAFPDLADVLDDPDAEPLPPSLELHLAPAAKGRELDPLRRELLTALPGVDWVDDDRAWLDRLEALVSVARTVGLGFGGLLLFAAVFTISSVIRLTAYRYRDEIAVMRQIGATELLIRCPFYLEGCLQGFLGGLTAIVTLWLIHGWISAEASGEVIRMALAQRFLPAPYVAGFLLLGTLAGGVGAVLSLRREFVELEPGLD